MKTLCEKIQGALIDLGPEWVSANSDLRNHLASCPQCRTLHASLAEIEKAVIYSSNASFRELIFRRLERIDQRPFPVETDCFKKGKSLPFFKESGIPYKRGTLMIVGIIALFIMMLIIPFLGVRFSKTEWGGRLKTVDKQTLSHIKRRSSERSYPQMIEEPEDGSSVLDTSSDDAISQNSEKGILKKKEVEQQEVIRERNETAFDADEEDVFGKAHPIPENKSTHRLHLGKPSPVPPPVPSMETAPKTRPSSMPKAPLSPPPLTASGLPCEYIRRVDHLVNKKGDRNLSVIQADSSTHPPKTALDRFLAEQSELKTVVCQEANGYWANTYIPGDPVFRRLGVRMKGWDRSGLTNLLGPDAGLDRNVFPVAQPFDTPNRGALSLYLNTDKRGISEKSRIRVQVGLQATDRGSGNRSRMNIGIVLDIHDTVSPDAQSQLRALVQSFLKAREIGDRFSLVIAGRPSQMGVSSKNFRFGYISVLFDDLFSKKTVTDAPLGLLEALQVASQNVSLHDEPTAPLGSSAIILVTSRSLGSLISPITQLAHKNAVNGIPMSVIGIGPHIVLDELDQIVLSGQGNRRLLNDNNRAEEIVEREITATSRVVARALRLRIRLLGDTRLVDVIGSRRLDTLQQERVKAAEKSIDLRIARDLGIKADRDKDEDGIQIIIPAFYAGDSHVIMLDLIATKSGPLVDVTLRYKDLIMMRNGTARANISVDGQTFVQGPLEHNVLKNQLALRLAQILKQTGDHYAQGHLKEAIGLVENSRALLLGFQQYYPGFSRDQDLTNDIALLENYLLLLKTPHAIQSGYIADSLRYSGYLKLMSRPSVE